MQGQWGIVHHENGGPGGGGCHSGSKGTAGTPTPVPKLYPPKPDLRSLNLGSMSDIVFVFAMFVSKFNMGHTL